MKRLLCVLGGVAVAIVLAVPVEASLINYAEGKPVSTTGVEGVMVQCPPCWPAGALAPLSSIVDGVFLPETSVWQTNTVWWDEQNPGSFDNIIEIDLQGNFSINKLILQADNNDSYEISYRDWGGTWIDFGSFGPIAGFGMMTRVIGDVTLQASAFRINASGGDQLYSVSEFQAIPEPGVLALLGIGIVGAIRRRVRA
jgi:PEP-CTERM motif